MRRLRALLLVCLVSLPVSASQGGVNESISLEGTSIETLHYDEVMRTSNGTSDSADYSVILLMDDDSNISNIRWITQVCINSGICYPPQETHMDRGDDGEFVGKLDTDDVTLMGHSFGGCTVLSAAAQRPDLISAVVAHEPAIDWMPDSARRALFSADRMEQLETPYSGGTVVMKKKMKKRRTTVNLLPPVTCRRLRQAFMISTCSTCIPMSGPNSAGVPFR